MLSTVPIIACSVSMLILTHIIDSSFAKNKKQCEYRIDLESNGPVTLDVPITFTATLSCYLEGEDYIYIFEDNAFPVRRQQMTGNNSASATFIYPEKTYTPGRYLMKLTAYYRPTEDLFPFFSIKVASSNITFDVNEFIPGTLNLTGIVTRQNDDNLYAATGSDINMTIEIHYPPRVYNDSEMSYSWSIDEDQFITTFPFHSYKFSKVGTFVIHVTAVARIPLYDEQTKRSEEIKYKWGHYYQKVVVKVDHLNTAGRCFNRRIM